MAIKVKAIERNVAFNKNAEPKWMYVMQPELYGQLDADKVITEAAKNCAMPKPAMQSAMDAYGEVVKTWATEGHSVPIPGLGTMRFGVRSNAVDDVNKVSTSLITLRHVIFTPSVDIKNELAKTSINITCYDRNGKIIKQVASADKDDVDDGKENTGSDSSQGSGTDGKTDSGQDNSQGGGNTDPSDGDNSY